MKKYYKSLALVATLLGTGFLVFMILFISTLSSSITYKNQLENSYMKSFYEMVESVNDIEMDMSKVIATSSVDSQRELLSGIYQSCVLGVNNINLLPISYNNLTHINNFMNTTGGFVYSLLLSSYQGNAISESDYVQLNDIHTRVQDIQYDLNDYMSKLQYNYSILDDVNFGQSENSDFSAGLINNESASTKVPTLIYDGPFSDSVLNAEIKGLVGEEITKEQAAEKLHDIYSGFAIDYVGDTKGRFETYNFNVKADVDLYVSITKKGGILLTITAYGDGNSARLSLSEGVELAQSFAKDVGLENMYSVWHQQTGNVLYVNLAPIKNKVIYYPDLIKVKIDLSLGLVVGWEATHYVTNHNDRDFQNTMGILDAQKNINSILEIQERNLCIVPDKYVGEKSAYEFICTWKNYTYYIYVDASTGKELNIMRVLSTNNGDLLM